MLLIVVVVGMLDSVIERDVFGLTDEAAEAARARVRGMGRRAPARRGGGPAVGRDGD